METNGITVIEKQLMDTIIKYLPELVKETKEQNEQPKRIADTLEKSESKNVK